MNGKVVTVIITLIFLIAVLIPFFVNISAEGPEKEFVQLREINIKAEKINVSHAIVKFLISIYRSETVANTTLVVDVYDRITNLLLHETKVNVPEKG